MIDEGVYAEKLSGVGTVNVVGTNIGDYTFYGNSTVMYVLATDVQNIGSHAFANNSMLITVTVCGNTNI